MFKKLLIKSTLLLFLAQLSFATGVDDIRWITQVSEPFTYVDKKTNKKTGIVIDVLSAILKKNGAKTTADNFEFEKYARGFLAAEKNPNIAFFSVAEIPENKNKFKWLGPMVIYKPILLAKKSKKNKD